jgi:phage-related protein
LEDITEKFMEKILDLVDKNVKDALKKFQDTKNKEHEMTQKQIKEFRRDFNEQQSKTKDTIKREIYGLKLTTQNIKEEQIKPRVDRKYQTTREEMTSNQREALIQPHTTKSLNNKNN